MHTLKDLSLLRKLSQLRSFLYTTSVLVLVVHLYSQVPVGGGLFLLKPTNISILFITFSFGYHHTNV